MRVLPAVTVLVAILFLYVTISSLVQRSSCGKLWTRRAGCASSTSAPPGLPWPLLENHEPAGVPPLADSSHDLPTVNYSAVWMRPSEIDVLLPHLQSVDTYLEWGSGGSTLNFAPFAHRAAHSIEHDSKWCATLRNELSQCAKCDRVHYHCVRVGRGHRNWGLNSRFEEGTYFQFDVYVDKVEELGEPSFDFVLIDGRARVAAALKALAYISSQSRVVLHDAARIELESEHHPKYDLVKTYYDFDRLVVGKGQPGIAVMRRKSRWDFLQGNVSAVNVLLQARSTQ